MTCLIYKILKVSRSLKLMKFTRLCNCNVQIDPQQQQNWRKNNSTSLMHSSCPLKKKKKKKNELMMTLRKDHTVIVMTQRDDIAYHANRPDLQCKRSSSVYTISGHLQVVPLGSMDDMLHKTDVCRVMTRHSEFFHIS